MRMGVVAGALWALGMGCGTDTVASGGADGSRDAGGETDAVVAADAADDGSPEDTGSEGGPGGDADSGTSSRPDGGGEAPASCELPEVGDPVFHVATNGDDGEGDGSEDAPWASIGHAVGQVPDGSTILVGPGRYDGRVRLDRAFDERVIVRSSEPYRAQLRNTEVVVTSYSGRNITLAGFDIAHSGPGAGALVIHVQNEATRHIAIVNNVLHDSYNNDILKINNGTSDILVERNVFYNQTGSDEHIDINSVEDVTVRDNVFFNDFAGSGRTNDNTTSSYIVVKDSNADSDRFVGSARVAIQRNVFLNWEGNAGANFVLLGEDGTANHEARDVTVENNLMLGNSGNDMRASFGVKGCRDVVFRNNTISGDLPSNAFAMRLNREGDNPQLEGIAFFNNIWSDPTGTMGDFSDTPPDDTASFTLSNNVYYNGGAPIPDSGGTDLVDATDDQEAVFGDPALRSPTAITLPRWSADAFAEGSATTCEVHRRLVELYGAIGAGSVAIDAADAVNAPADDILGRPRDGAADIGAFERVD